MYISTHFISPLALVAAYFIWSAVLIEALRRAPWRRLRANGLTNVFMGAVVALVLLWHFDARLMPGLGYHFLGLTVFTLMFGWSLGVIGASLASLVIALQLTQLGAVAINALILGVLPVSVSYVIYEWVHQHLPHHLFIYIFLCAFLGSIIAAGVTVVALVGVLVIANIYPFQRIAQEYFPFLPLYLFPEGLLNGMLITMFAGLRPQWLKTFDEATYLQR